MCSTTDGGGSCYQRSYHGSSEDNNSSNSHESHKLGSASSDTTSLCQGCAKQRRCFSPLVTLLFLIILSVPYAGAQRWDLDKSESSDTRFGEYNGPCPGKIYKRHSLSGGTSAGRYTKIGMVDTIDECAAMCCQEEDCTLALTLHSPKKDKRTCFNVECYGEFNSDKCTPMLSSSSRYEPALFHKYGNPRSSNVFEVNGRPEDSAVGPGSSVTRYVSEEDREPVKNSEELAAQFLPHENSNHKDESTAGACQAYQGVTCAKILDKSKQYYYLAHDPMSLDQRLTRPMDLLKSRLSQKCFDLALEVICYRFYPLCSVTSTKPIHICNDCNQILNGDCIEEFQRTNMEDYLKRVIRGCTAPDEEQQQKQTNCINRKSVSTSGATVTPVAGLLMSSKDLMNDEPSSISTTAPPSHKSLTPASSLHPEVHLNATTSPSKVHTAPVTGPGGTAPVTRPGGNSNSTTVINSNSTSTVHLNTTLISKSHPTTTTTTKKKKKKKKPEPKPGQRMKVSAGDSTTLTLPTSSVDLFASTWPKEKTEGDYSYKWSEISSPKGSHGYIAGGNTKNLKLTKLDHEGVYTFKLTVVSASDKNLHGVGYVNVTVQKPVRINHPPRAEITQKEHVIQLPINTVILDGSKSTDDDKIVSYKWEELEGPLKKKPVFSSDQESILQLKDLVEGVYKLRLTVTDSDGLKDATEATVTVKKETDYPPKANAGRDMMIRLPLETVILNGNKSTDDKGVKNLKYQWSKTADSPTCDMQGTDKSQLKISRLQEGTYVFTLKVTDKSEHSDEARVKVLVLPEQNTPPVARAGDDKEIMYPDDSTTLDGSKSTDNSKIASYHWQQISGPSKAKLTGANAVKVHLTDLVVGEYKMKLTVTDDKDATGSDFVTVRVKKDHNAPPVAVVAKPEITVYLPTRDVVVDGSRSHDDEMIEVYKWVRAGLSPAAGVVVNKSDDKPMLRLTNLVKGRYIFDLTVTDNKGLKGTTSVTIQVKESPRDRGLVELHLRYDLEAFTEGNKVQLIRKISVLLEVERNAVVFEELQGSTYGHGLKILFYVRDPNLDRILDGKYIADVLKQKVGFGGKLFEYFMERVEPYVCRKNCSDHGYCDKSTKVCVCDSFWTSNFLKEMFGEKESNCDWSILYLSVAVFGIFLVFIGVAWSVCFCFARQRRNKRHARYHVLRGGGDPEKKNKSILLVPNGKGRYSADSASAFSDSDSGSEATTLYEKNRRPSNGHVRAKSSRNSSNNNNDNGMGYIEESVFD